MNKNKTQDDPNIWDTVKSVPRGKVAALNAYLHLKAKTKTKSLEKSHTNNLMTHLKAVENQ